MTVALRLVSLFFIFLLFSCDAPHPYQQGEILYVNFCSNCHMTDGSGLQNLIPPLNNKEYLKGKNDIIACAIVKGVKGEIQIAGKTYNTEMEPIMALNDIEITNVINYIQYTWGDGVYAQNPEVVEALKECLGVEEW